MTKGIFAHRSNSIYDDIPEEQYQFPRRYLRDAQLISGNWILYHEPRKGGGDMTYFAIAKVKDIIPDPGSDDMFLARIVPQSFVPFETRVPYRTGEEFLESGMGGNGRKPNQGLIRKAIRPISDGDFHRIIARGFSPEDAILPRETRDDEPFQQPGFRDVKTPFEFDSPRQTVEQLVTRKVRDRAFRKQVLEAYDSTCAITGLQFFNGGGRAEVQAAHIKPVEHDGPDSIRNGLALSGTVHWMFDRGLISLGENFEVLVSRHVNNPDQVWNLVHNDKMAIIPNVEHKRPHPTYLSWHREHCFKH